MCISTRFTLIALVVAMAAPAVAQESGESTKKAWFEKVLNDHAFSGDAGLGAEVGSGETRLPPVSEAGLPNVGQVEFASNLVPADPAPHQPLITEQTFPEEALLPQHVPPQQPPLWNEPGPAADPNAMVHQPRQTGFDVMPADPQVLNASHQIVNTGREMLDAGRGVIDAQPTTGPDGQPRPALSNYYGHVTVNYYVSPNGDQPMMRPASYQADMDPFSDDEVVSELIGPPLGMSPHHPVGVPCGCVPCCKPLRSHCLGVFGEALYLRPGNLDVIYATEQLGCDPDTATPTGPLGIANMDSEPGFRAGFILPLSSCASLVATYTWLQSDTNSSITAAPGAVLGSRVLHPSIENCGLNSTSASAKFDVDFQMMDLDYRRILWQECNWGVNYIAGVRYGRLTQEFESSQIAGAAVGLAHVTSDIDFDGVGIRLGLDGERHSTHTGMFIYGRGVINMLGGEYQATYLQTNQFDPTANIGVQYEDYRLSTILEGELGVGWQSCSGHVRLSLGYQGLGWYNTLLTGAFIDGIANHGQFTETNDDFLTFDGLVGRVEFRR